MTEIEQKIHTHACLVVEYTYPNLDPLTPAYKKLVKATVDFVSQFFNAPVETVSNPARDKSEIPIVLYRKNWVTLMGCIDNSINNIKESRAEIERAYSRIRHAVTGADAAINQIELGIIELDDIKTIIHNKL